MNNRIGLSIYLAAAIFLSVSFYSCESEYTPKPKGFFRIDFPEKKYQVYDDACPFRFQYPQYAHIEHDHYPGAEPCWLNIEYPAFQATIHLSYREILRSAGGETNLRQLTEDSRTLAMKHSSKAESIEENTFYTPKGIAGLRYDIAGNAASPLQFYLTDSTKHFLRASLYFNVNPQADSIAPVLNFISRDIERMLVTFEWK